MRKFIGWIALASGTAAGAVWACGSPVTACDDTEKGCADMADGSAEGPLVMGVLPEATDEFANVEEGGVDGRSGTRARRDAADEKPDVEGDGSAADGDDATADTQGAAALGSACSGTTECPNCVNGVCCSTPSCPAGDACHLAATCLSLTGECSAPPPAPSTTVCTVPHAATALCDGAGNCLAATCDNGFENDQGVCKAPGCVGVACGGSDGAGGLCTGDDGICASGQHCSSGGQCVCDGSSCSGCCDASGKCQTSAMATCGIGGVSCQACTGGCCTASGTCEQYLYPDMDHDGFGDGTATPVCGQPTTTMVADNTDCCDTDNRAHPQGAPASPADYPGLTTLEDGGVGPQVADNCGTFDYDCSGSAVELYANLCTPANFPGCGPTCTATVVGTCAFCGIGPALPPAPCPIGVPGVNAYNGQPSCGGTAYPIEYYSCEILGGDCVQQTNGEPTHPIYQLCF
jgi:hypothetical protein